MRQIRTALSVATGTVFLLGLAAAQDQTNTPLTARSTLPFQMAERQREAVLSMPSVKVTYHRAGTVRSIRGETGIAISGAARALRKGESGKDVLAVLRNVILANGQEELTLINSASSFPTQRGMNFSQSIAGIPVIGGGIGLVVESASGAVKVVNSHFLPDRNLPRVPKLTREDAKEATSKALYSFFAALPKSVGFSDEPITLAYVGRSDSVDRDALVWVVTAGYLTDEKAGQGYRNIWIDALTGEYVGSESLMSHVHRTVYSANGATVPPASLPNGLTLLFTEGNVSGSDSAAIDLYGHVFAIENTWQAEVGPSPLSSLRLVVHYRQPFPVPQWGASYVFANSNHYLTFGDGDATAGSPARVRDIVAHEFGHAVYRSRYPHLIVNNTESSALNEAHADFLSGLVDEQVGGIGSSATWQIGPVFFDSTRFIRSWKNPDDLKAVQRGFYWYPKALRASQWDYENSTIIGHWFYLLAAGGRNASFGIDPDVPDITVQGRGWDIAQFIFNSALFTGGLPPSPKFTDVRAATENAAQLLGSTTLASTRAAWDAVGVGFNCSGPPPTPDLILRDRCAGRWVLKWPSVPGATTYHGEAVPVGWPWSLSTPIIDGNLNVCHQTIRQDYYVRLRACNGCGCSEFTVPETMTYFPGACP